MRTNISINNNLFRSHKTHSAEEILAAGGADAFGKTTGKDNSTLIKALEEIGPIEPFTQEEWEELQRQLDNDK